MIARIIGENDNEYSSVVFAAYGDGKDFSVIVFNGEKNTFLPVKMYECEKYIIRKVFLIDCDESGFIEGKLFEDEKLRVFKNLKGYEWLVTNEKLLGDIIGGNAVPNDYKQKAKELNSKIVVNEWTEVENEKDVKSLMVLTGDFHDSSIGKIEFNGYSLEVVFKGCWGCKVTLRFDGFEDMRLSCEAYYEIFSSSVFFDDDFVYWADEENVNVRDIENEPEINYFKARSLRYKCELNHKSD